MHELIADAGRGMTATAEAADTGERWTLYRQYDAQYVVDLKPSVPWVRDERGLRPRYVGIPDCAYREDPADFAVVHEHADHIAGLDPAVGKAIGHLMTEIGEAARTGVGPHEHDDDHCSVPACRITQAAHAVARAYLRSEGDE